MNKMPKVAPAADIDWLKICVPYLARRKADGEIVTVMRANDQIIYIKEDDTSTSDVTYFFNNYEVVREFVRGEDTVTIGAW